MEDAVRAWLPLGETLGVCVPLGVTVALGERVADGVGERLGVPVDDALWVRESVRLLLGVGLCVPLGV